MSTLTPAELSVGAAIAPADSNTATSSVVRLTIIPYSFNFNADAKDVRSSRASRR
jgi:hypothetical protein